MIILFVTTTLLIVLAVTCFFRASKKSINSCDPKLFIQHNYSKGIPGNPFTVWVQLIIKKGTKLNLDNANEIRGSKSIVHFLCDGVEEQFIDGPTVFQPDESLPDKYKNQDSELMGYTYVLTPIKSGKLSFAIEIEPTLIIEKKESRKSSFEHTYHLKSDTFFIHSP